jgi:hypothetical protein
VVILSSAGRREAWLNDKEGDPAFRKRLQLVKI